MARISTRAIEGLFILHSANWLIRTGILPPGEGVKESGGWSMSGYARSLQERNVTTSDPTVRRMGDKSEQGVDAAQAVCWCFYERASCVYA